MSSFQRIGGQQLLREAEGYLDLISVLADEFPVAENNRMRLAERALATLDRAEHRVDRRSQHLFVRGRALKDLGRFAEAVVPLEEATELDPENIRIWLLLGWCHKRCGRLDLAIQALEDALMVDGSEAIVYYNLACYWSLANSPKLAVAYLSRSLEINPDYRDQIAAESDFDPIREHADFLALTRVVV